ncbi:hypothetical protein [Fluviicola sp.]|jgi:hypothetical protein|uniref:hypothetical protein n=1 Tax=Fluviicola sp. TaxID=1917219 RepID=UPI00281C70F5|nr:hypothetical protein [Fluviicola sp.]MDR0802099.1 hypothetical protein [Fluviicola sp.]
MSEGLKISFIGIACWWLLLLPFDYTLFNWFFHSVQSPFFSILKSLDETLIFETDTFGTYLLIALSLILGILSGFPVKWLCKKLRITPTALLKTVLAGILFLFLFKYGWDKLVKIQFYRPEPNILYTPFGKLSKDIAYWSLTGASYPYTVALGSIELLIALLLLFKRTQFLASLLSIIVFAQIVLINFSFDISVKLLSASLLIFSLVYTSCFPENWKGILGLKNTPSFTKNTLNHRIVKGIFAFAIVLECTLPSFRYGNFNDDQFPRLKHHGAYEVLHSSGIRRMFIHRDGYLILESQQGVFSDFKLDIRDPNRYQVSGQPFTCLWKQTGNQLIFKQDTFQIRPIPYKELPVLRESFHPFSDEFH